MKIRRWINNFWIRRTAVFFLTGFLASVIIFALLFLLPGDIVDVIAGDVITSPEVKEVLREELGLNDPVVVQYGRWLWSMASGGFGGESLVSGQPISQLLTRQFPVTLLLAGYTVLLAVMIAVPLATAAVLNRNRWLDYVIRIGTIPGQILPGFWLALLLLLGLVIIFRWSPPLYYTHPWQDVWNHLQIVFLPVFLLTWEYGSHVLRVTRSSLLDTMKQEFVIASRAKGLSNKAIITRHGLRAAAVPVITVLGVQFGVLLGGTIVLEYVFGLPGMGRELVEAALARDIPVVQSYVTIMVLLVLLLNLLLDFLYRYFDPRIRTSSIATEVVLRKNI